jgi:hypothetical protein
MISTPEFIAHGLKSIAREKHGAEMQEESFRRVRKF